MDGAKCNLIKMVGVVLAGWIFLLSSPAGEAADGREETWDVLVDRAGAINRLDVRLSGEITEQLERKLVVDASERRRFEWMRVSTPQWAVEDGLGSVRNRWESKVESWQSSGKQALVAGAYGSLADLHWRFGKWEEAEMWLERAVAAAEGHTLGAETRLRLLESGVMLHVLSGQADAALRLLDAVGADLRNVRGMDLPDVDLLEARVWGILGGADGNRGRMGNALARFGERLGAGTALHLQREYWSHRIVVALWEGRVERARHFLSVLQATGVERTGVAGNPLALAWEYFLDGGKGGLGAEALVAAFREAGCPVCFELMAASWYRLGLSGMASVEALFRSEPVLGWRNHGTPLTRVLGQRLQAQGLAEEGDEEAAYAALKRAQDLREILEAHSRDKADLWQGMEAILGNSVEDGAVLGRTGVALFYGLCAALLVIAVVLVFVLRSRTRSELTLHLENMLEKARSAERMAEQANRYKSQFLANVSHEIRTPMNGIIGMASLLEELVEDDRQRHCLETIQVCSQNLMVLLNDLVDLSRIETGTLELERIPFEPRELLEQSERLTATAFAEAGVELQVKCAESLPVTVVGDAVHIGQIVLKLLHNALDRCDGGAVQLRAEYEETMGVSGNLLVTVSHAGAGYAGKDLALLFEPFSEVELDKGSTHGNGLALPLGSRLAESMGGKLEAESEGGKGCRLLLRVPVRVTREEPEYLRNRFNTFAMGRTARSTVAG